MSDHKDTAENLRVELTAAREKNGQSYPKELKARVVEYAERRRDLGVGFGRVAAELKLNPSTVYHWVKGKPWQTRSDGELIKLQTLADPEPESKREVVLTVGNATVRGLSLDQLVELLRRLS